MPWRFRRTSEKVGFQWQTGGGACATNQVRSLMSVDPKEVKRIFLEAVELPLGDRAAI